MTQIIFSGTVTYADNTSVIGASVYLDGRSVGTKAVVYTVV